MNKKNARIAGILLPIASLNSPYGIGTLGKQAYRFVDFLEKSGQKCWQILPIGPTSYGDSPYQSFSAFAGNPYFIDLDTLISEKLITKGFVSSFDWGSNPIRCDYEKIYTSRFKVLRKAFENFTKEEHKGFEKFKKKNRFWLEDYTLYMAVKVHFENKSWMEWEDDIRLRRDSAVKRYKKLLSDELEFWAFVQFKFFEQWKKLKAYANEKGIKIIGDIPIYVATDSADVWANHEQFLLNDDHRPTLVAGCPPDYFSEDGQLWGNAIYDWSFMKKDSFSWWKNRISFSAMIYDTIRIDHFIGIVRYYGIPADSKSAKVGKYYKGPGMKLIKAIDEARGECTIIAEDLGAVTDSVRKLIERSGYPGMKILQFAFGSDTDNEHLPMNYTRNLCVYPGTHDNDTLATAISNMDIKTKKYLLSYLGKDNADGLVFELIRLLYASVANTAIVQLQDILELDNSSRMNIPSTLGGNWEWRIKGNELTSELSRKLRKLSEIYGRAIPKEKPAVKKALTADISSSTDVTENVSENINSEDSDEQLH